MIYGLRIYGLHQTQHIKYCWAGYEVNFHLAMSMTRARTNTNTKCLKDPMCVIFLKSRWFTDFKYSMDILDMDMLHLDMANMDMDVVDMDMVDMGMVDMMDTDMVDTDLVDMDIV